MSSVLSMTDKSSNKSFDALVIKKLNSSYFSKLIFIIFKTKYFNWKDW